MQRNEVSVRIVLITPLDESTVFTRTQSCLREVLVSFFLPTAPFDLCHDLIHGVLAIREIRNLGQQCGRGDVRIFDKCPILVDMLRKRF
ncbi:hypothetical protein BHQ18_09450 [Mycolicibacterium flavescens]|uniref:Uncharacterized protein n=1 Tax=Mycolicibacterium flavescens TaxID=1776 RepID=A0A1E3RM47_MYCFV|nr:hypothetical protein BHQ18_09450 [Mycolicibacterium flavescens]